LSDIISEEQAEQVSISDFSKADLRVGRVIGAERVAGSDKLLKLIVDTGAEKREIIAGLGQSYTPDQVIERNVVIVANLLPRMFRLREGPPLVSQGMLLAAEVEGEVVLLVSDKPVPPGTKVK
jgi:methionine--tRNA ligase beta chain